jgi:hypothetical protein
MSDLVGVNDTLPVRIGGVSSSSGLPDNYADVTPAGQLLVLPGDDGPVTPGNVANYSSLIGGQYNSILPVVGSGQQVAVQLDSSGRIIVSPTTILYVDDVWNIASVSGNIAVTTTPVQIKVGASALANRKVFYIQPQDGNVWIGSTNSVSTVVGNTNCGIEVFRAQSFPMIFTNNVPIWMVAASGTVNVVVMEGS